MSCCSGCAGKEKQVWREVEVYFDGNSDIAEGLVGKDFELTAVGFMGCPAGLPETMTSHISQTGDSWLLSIYKVQLPFNELVATVQFNPKTGQYSWRAFSRLDFNGINLHLKVVPVDQPNYMCIGPGMFRVRNYAGIYDIIDRNPQMKAETTAAIKSKAKANSHSSRWPIFLYLEDKEKFSIRCADVLNIPDWKNDQVWQ